MALQEGIHYVYMGNVPGHKGTHTYCHNCGKMIVHRFGFRILDNQIDAGKCGLCGTAVPGVWA